MAHRFYVPPDAISDNEVRFSGDQRKQIKNVLRLRAGDVVNVFDGAGQEFAVSLKTIDDPATGVILQTTTPSTEPEVRLTLIQSLPKGEKIDLILQKCTEVGVSNFLFLETARSIPHVSPEKLPSRLERWRSIVKEAAEQSGRVRLPSVDWAVSFDEALKRISSIDHRLIAWECHEGSTLMSKLPEFKGAKDIALFIGPEGGFTEQEIEKARNAGVTPISLGSRILRTETAAIVGSALIIYRSA